MISISSLIGAFFLGLYGGPHCIAMCGNICNLIFRKSGANLLSFHLFRILGYGLLGFLAGHFFSFINQLLITSKPFYSLRFVFHLIIILWGGYMMIYGRHPLFLDNFGRLIWTNLRSFRDRPLSVPFYGLLWVFIPCSLIYAAIAIAMLSTSGLNGFLVMLFFGLGTLGPTLSYSLILQKFMKVKVKSEMLILKIAGVVMIFISLFSLLNHFNKNISYSLWCL